MIHLITRPVEKFFRWEIIVSIKRNSFVALQVRVLQIRVLQVRVLQVRVLQIRVLQVRVLQIQSSPVQSTKYSMPDIFDASANRISVKLVTDARTKYDNINVAKVNKGKQTNICFTHIPSLPKITLN